jgi:hypothetical protein
VLTSVKASSSCDNLPLLSCDNSDRKRSSKEVCDRISISQEVLEVKTYRVVGSGTLEAAMQEKPVIYNSNPGEKEQPERGFAGMVKSLTCMLAFVGDRYRCKNPPLSLL